MVFRYRRRRDAELDASHLCDLLEEAEALIRALPVEHQCDMPRRIRLAVDEARAALERQEEELFG